MSKYWSSLVNQLTPYTPGEQPATTRLIKLNTNENPYGPSPLALAAMARELGDSLRLYPNPDGMPIKNEIAAQNARHGITPAHVFVGNGSDEVLAHAFQALLQHDDPIVFPDISYSFYPTYCSLYQVAYRTVPLAQDYSLQVDDYLQAGLKIGGIIFPNPNAPTGCLLALSEIERLVAAQPEIVVIVDEAYIDFGGTSALALVARYPNLLVVQTLSKSRSLAGLRVGFAVGHPDLIAGLERVKNSFNSYPLDRLAIVGAVAALQDVAHFDQTRHAVMASRQTLAAGLTELGFEVLPSAANFVFARHARHDAGQLANMLRDQDILVRHFKSPRIAQFLRITVGTDDDCQALLDKLREYLQ